MTVRQEEIQRRMETLKDCESDLVHYGMRCFYRKMDQVDRQSGFLYVDESGREQYREGRRIDWGK